MAGSAIVRALKRSGYGNPEKGGELLTPSRQELDLLDDEAVRHWMSEQKPDVVVLAAATVGGIEANRSRPADFLLENLRIETQVIEAAWRAGARRLLFLGKQLHLPEIRRSSQFERNHCSQALWSPPMRGTRSPRSPESSSARHCASSTALMQSALMPTNLYGPGDNYHPNGQPRAAGSDPPLPRSQKKQCRIQ